MTEQGLVLTGRVLGFMPVKPDSPHYKVQVHDGDRTYWMVVWGEGEKDGPKTVSPIIDRLEKDSIQSFRVRVKATLYQPDGGAPKAQLDVSAVELIPVAAGK